MARPPESQRTALASPAGLGRVAAGAVVVGATLAVGVAVWVAPASLHIVAWPDTGLRLVGFVPPVEWLWLALAAALVVGTALAMGCERLWHLPLTALAWRMAPLLLLTLWAVPYLPGAGRLAPLLLLLAGPAKWAMAALAGIGVFWPWLRTAAGRVAATALPRPVLFAAALALFLTGGVSTIRTMGPGGDEPHYLVIAHSLVQDGDLQIENNHAQRDYGAFFEGVLPMDFLARGVDGVVYSLHAPGLPTVVAPAYAMAGYPGVVVMMSLLSALLTLAIYDLACRVAEDRAARLTWLVTTVSVPVVPLAWMIYPEVGAALVMAWAARWIVEPVSGDLARWVRRGAVLALLPWLHTKFAVLLACVGVGLAVRLWPRVRLLAALGAPVAISLAAWLGAAFVMYGRIDPMAAYGGGAGAGLSLSNVPRGLLGLALDQEFGLLLFAPVYALAAAGTWLLLRRPPHRWFVVWSLATVGLFGGAVTQAYMWWGGLSPPARFLLPLVPIVAPMLAAAAPGVRRPVLAGAWWVTGAWGLAVVVAGWTSDRLELLIEDRDGVSRLIRELAGPAPLNAALGSFIREDWVASLVDVVPWIVAVAAALWLARLAARAASARGEAAYWAGVALVVGTLAGGAVLAGPRLTATERSAIERRGQGDLLTGLGAEGLRVVQYDPPAWVSQEQLLAETVLAAGADTRRVLEQGPSTMLGPFNLPAGRYELRLFRTDARDVMPVSVVYYLRRLRGTVAAETNGTGSPVVVPFELPVGLDGVWARVPGDGGTVSRVEVVPREVVPRQARLDRGDGVRALRRLPGPRGGVVYFIDDVVEPDDDHFWIGRQQTGVVVVAVPGGYQPVVTVTNTGTAPDNVRIASGDWAESLRLAPGGGAEVLVPVMPGRRATTVAVTTTLSREASPRQRVDCRVSIRMVRLP